MWSIIEINFSIVATCMPATAGLLQHLYRWSRGQSLSTSTGYVAKQSQITTVVGSQDEQKSPKSDLESGSPTDLANCETALAQGEVDGRLKREMKGPGQVTEVHDSPASAAEPAEAELRYRDDRDVVHKVIVRDVPEGRMPGLREEERDVEKGRRELKGIKAEV
ncbi:hypothetical protein PRZ48_011948 [Zasmidium cellare]|uniref:Uncharacterized protein n=1 Tax=Zasmidium cellare TaxID=395010 RepID=A0ABR0E7U4_ZASCE|nr:hypothetical protein PRZ48_011948 [Zasmidium cellare]